MLVLNLYETLEKLLASNLAGILHQPLELFKFRLVRRPQFEHHFRGFVVPFVPPEVYHPLHRVQPRLQIVREVIPRFFAYNVNAIS